MLTPTLGARVSWVRPYDRAWFGCVVRKVDDAARTADIEFADGGTRGAIPWADLAPPDPSRELATSGTADVSAILRARGIASEEGMGRI